MNTKALFYLMVSAVFYATFPIVNKFILNQGVDPMHMILGLNVFIFPMVLGYVIYRRKLVKKISKTNWKLIATMALFATFLGRITTLYAQKYTTAINFAMLVKLSAITVPIIAYFVLKERFTAQKYGGMLIAFVGTIFLVTSGSLIMPQLGDMITIAVVLSISIGNVLAKIVTKDVKPLLVVSLRLTIGSTLLFLLIPFTGWGFIDTAIQYAPFFLYLSIQALITVSSFYKAIQLSSASEATVLFLISAPLALGMSYLFLGEMLSNVALFGAALLLFGCYIVAKKGKIPDLEESV